jgi:hypothetical protein
MKLIRWPTWFPKVQCLEVPMSNLIQPILIVQPKLTETNCSCVGGHDIAWQYLFIQDERKFWRKK